LEQGNLSPEDQQGLGNLLNLLLSTMDDSMIQDAHFSKHLVNTVADQGKLLLMIQRQAAELDAIKRISLNLTSSLELQVVLDGVVSEAMQLVKDAHEAHIYLYQDDKLTFGAALNDEGVKNLQVSAPRPEGLTNMVVFQKKLMIIEDMEAAPLFIGAPKPWSGSIIGIPLLMGGRVVGVMNLVRSRKGEFSDSELRLLGLLADQAAIAILNARLHHAVSKQARSDVLTGLPNRRALDERLEEEINRSKKSGLPFSVVMMDIDKFKDVNETYGHDIGDDVLKQVSVGLVRALRASDFLARYGGDEMTLILPETNLQQAKIVVGKIISCMSELDIRLPQENTARLTICGGVALYPAHAEAAAGLLRAADEALYRAKRTGHGQFMVAVKN
jgi:diguanylate cyclase (GGDEF)-like protein